MKLLCRDQALIEIREETSKLREDGIVESKLVRIEAKKELTKRDNRKIERKQRKIAKKEEKIAKISEGKAKEDLYFIKRVRVGMLTRKINKLNGEIAERAFKPRRVTTFESDGIRNKMSVNLLSEDFDDTSFVLAESIDLFRATKELEKEKKKREEAQRELEEKEREKEEADRKLQEAYSNASA